MEKQSKIVKLLCLVIVNLCGCSKIIEQAQGDTHKPHEIYTTCEVSYGDHSESLGKTFPLHCEADKTIQSVTKEGGMWKIVCVKPYILCQTCVDGVCQLPPPVDDFGNLAVLKSDSTLF